MSSRLLLSVLLLLLCGRAAQAHPIGRGNLCLGPGIILVGSVALIDCNGSRGHADVKWFNPQGDELGKDAGEKWQIEENGALNISAASLKDQGEYTCVYTSDGGVTKSYMVNLNAPNSDSHLRWAVFCIIFFILGLGILCILKR